MADEGFDLDRGLRIARNLDIDVLALHAGPMMKGQNDRADHRHKKDEAGNLEEVDVIRVENIAECSGVMTLGNIRNRQRSFATEYRRERISAQHDHQFGDQQPLPTRKKPSLT